MVAATGVKIRAARWLEPGKAIDVDFEGDVQAVRAAAEGAFARADAIVQRSEGRARRLIVADMDSTMITIECIDELADYAGIKPQIAEVTERAMRGELDFEAALRSRVALLEGLPESAIDQCLAERVKIMPGAQALVRTVRAQGGTAILSETPEIHGVEFMLTRRAVSPAVGQKLLDRLAWWAEYTRGHNAQFNGVVGHGNQAGGLANIFEKSLGSAMKGGTTPLVEVYRYAEPIDKPGFVFMDSPGYDPVATTGQIASGANLICFTTGRGSMFGSKPAPTIKLASNTPMFKRLEEDMDINCGAILDGECDMQQLGQRIFDHLLRTASGDKTKSELLGLGDHEFVPWHLGIVS